MGEGLKRAFAAAKATRQKQPPALSDDELDTILAIARNRQSGRITEFEVKALVAAYRKLHQRDG